MIEPLFRMLGGLTPYVTMFGLAALKLPAVAVTAIAALMMAPYFLLALAREGSLPIASDNLCSVLGLLQYAMLLVVVGRIFYKPDDGNFTSRSDDPWRVGWFLVIWTILEVIGYFVLSPFLAVRRIMGVVVLETLVVGRLLSKTCQSPDKKALVHGITFAGIGLGLLYYTVDYLEASAQKQAVERIRNLSQVNPMGTVWFAGHWGFQFYAEHAGMQPVVPGQSTLRRGDWLVVPDRTIDQQRIPLKPTAVRLIHSVEIHDYVPLRTVPGYYDAGSSAFFEYHQGPRLTLQVYELTSDFTP